MVIYAVMPRDDYEDACNAIREKTGSTEVIKSGDMGNRIRAIKTGGLSQVLVKVGNSQTSSLFSVYDYETGTWVTPTLEGIIVSGLNVLWIKNNKYLIGASASVFLKDGSFDGTAQGEMGMHDIWYVRSEVSFDALGYIEISGTED